MNFVFTGSADGSSAFARERKKIYFTKTGFFINWFTPQTALRTSRPRSDK